MTLQALRYYSYGAPTVVQVQDVPKPAPGDDDILIRVHAASINSYDLHFMRGEPRIMRISNGLRGPKNPKLGSDVAGTVEAVGRNVSNFKVGDAVFGSMSGADNGGFAEYVCGPARLFAHKPTTADFTQAAALPMAGCTALQGVRDHARVQPGQAVLVYGGAGGVGTFAVQFARYYGGDVTAVCSTRNVEQTLALGANRVIDYQRTPFDPNERQYDIILGVNGYQPAWVYRKALKPGGRYYMLGGQNRQIMEQLVMLPLLNLRGGGKKMALVTAKESQEDLVELARMFDAGEITTVIDRCYPFSEAVDALAYVDAGHARGKVVITFDAA